MKPIGFGFGSGLHISGFPGSVRVYIYRVFRVRVRVDHVKLGSGLVITKPVLTDPIAIPSDNMILMNDRRVQLSACRATVEMKIPRN